jgi:hypothetical protein
MERGVQLGHYRLGPFVIMANHVHLLRLLQSLKGYTDRRTVLPEGIL